MSAVPESFKKKSARQAELQAKAAAAEAQAAKVYDRHSICVCFFCCAVWHTSFYMLLGLATSYVP